MPASPTHTAARSVGGKLMDNEPIIVPTLRQILGGYIGKRLLDVSQNDDGESPMMYLLFEDGLTLDIHLGLNGFHCQLPTDPKRWHGTFGSTG